MKRNVQVEAIETALKWISTCPYDYTISSMQGGFLHIKVNVPETWSRRYQSLATDQKTSVEANNYGKEF